MKIFRRFLLASLLVAGTSCSKAPPAEPELARPATIKDIMDSMVDPSGDFLFESIVTIADEKGIREKAPETDDEWKEVRARAIVLLEAPNLLVMPGRKVAQPGEKSKNPAVELSPDQHFEIGEKRRLQTFVFILPHLEICPCFAGQHRGILAP